MRTLAFAADADLWCPRCASVEYPGCLVEAVPDREGNIVTPIFSTSDDVVLEVCCRCGEELDPPPAEIAEEVRQLQKDGYQRDHSATELIEEAFVRTYSRSMEEVE